MANQNQLATQLAALVALILAWINPDSALNGAVQTAVVATVGAVSAIIHIVAVLEKKNLNGGSQTQQQKSPTE